MGVLWVYYGCTMGILWAYYGQYYGHTMVILWVVLWAYYGQYYGCTMVILWALWRVLWLSYDASMGSLSHVYLQSIILTMRQGFLLLWVPMQNPRSTYGDPITKDSTDESYIDSGASYHLIPLSSHSTHLSAVCEAHHDISSWQWNSGSARAAWSSQRWDRAFRALRWLFPPFEVKDKQFSGTCHLIALCSKPPANMLIGTSRACLADALEHVVQVSADMQKLCRWQHNGTNAVQVSLKLLEQGIHNRQKEVHHPNICSAHSLWGPHIKRHLPYVMETNHKYFFLCQEVKAAHQLLDLQAPLLLTSLNILYPNSFIVATADEVLACHGNE